MDWRKAFRGEYIAAVEFEDKQPTLTIKSVSIEKLNQEKGGKKDKLIARFKEAERGWVVNKTNAICLSSMFGNNTKDWIGKRITLFATMVPFGKNMEAGIRVKGSPDIPKPMIIDVKLPQKSVQKMRMEVTGKKGSPPPEPDPEPDPEPGTETQEEEQSQAARFVGVDDSDIEF